MRIIRAVFILSVFLLTSISVNLSQSVVASKNSNKFHSPSCRWALRISPSNLIEFKNADEAIAAGYIPCKTCNPSGSTSKETLKSNVTKLKQGSSQMNDDGRCQAITKKGTRCKRKAMPGSIYCWQHQR